MRGAVQSAEVALPAPDGLVAPPQASLLNSAEILKQVPLSLGGNLPPAPDFTAGDRKTSLNAPLRNRHAPI